MEIEDCIKYQTWALYAQIIINFTAVTLQLLGYISYIVTLIFVLGTLSVLLFFGFMVRKKIKKRIENMEEDLFKR